MSPIERDNHLTLDQKRLASLSRIMDCLGGIDLHETAAELADFLHCTEPGERQYYHAVCIAIDAYLDGTKSHDSNGEGNDR